MSAFMILFIPYYVRVLCSCCKHGQLQLGVKENPGQGMSTVAVIWYVWCLRPWAWVLDRDIGGCTLLRYYRPAAAAGEKKREQQRAEG